MPPKRTVLLRIALAFVGLLVGFVGAVLYVPLALWPVAQRADSIQIHRTNAVRVLDEVRGAARELRSAAVLVYQTQFDRTLDLLEQERAVTAARTRIQEVAAEYSRISRPRPPEIDREWRRLADVDFPALEAAVDGAVDTAARGRNDPATIRRVLAAGAAVDAGMQRLADINATAVQGDAERIRARIQRLAVGYVVLAMLGAAGALLLLFQVLAMLRTYTATAERRVRELEAFAGQVSHDLRSPLQTIQLVVAAVERKSQEEPIRRLAARASASVRRLDGMIHDLLQFARSGAAIQEAGRADVCAVLEEICDELHPVAERAGVDLIVVAGPHVHAAIAAVALKTIVVNLVENAIKYRRPGAESRVEVSATADRERAMIAVKDNGIGIAPDLIPQLFDPFFRGTMRPDSYGLGLATVRRLLDASDGNISVASEEGKGTTFSVELRLVAPASPPRVGTPSTA